MGEQVMNTYELRVKATMLDKRIRELEGEIPFIIDSSKKKVTEMLVKRLKRNRRELGV